VAVQDKRYLLGLALVAFLVSACRAPGGETDRSASFEQPIQEVFLSELVYPQEERETQISIAVQYENNDDDAYRTPLSLEYGITGAWRIELEWDAYADHERAGGGRTAGTGDVEIGTAYSFMNLGGSDVHAALGSSVTLPTGDDDRELGEGETTYEPYGVVAMDTPLLPRSQVFTQLGTELNDGAPEWFWNIGFFVPFDHRNRYVLTTEFNWTEEERYLTPGVVFNLPGTWELGVGAPIGLTSEADDYRVILFLTFEFGGTGDDD